jgi:hypothetical protein
MHDFFSSDLSAMVYVKFKRRSKTKIDVVLRPLRHVKEVKDALEEQVNALEASRMYLRQFAEFLNFEEEDGENWVEIAKERGAL